MNQIWKILFGIFILIALWFTSYALHDVYTYARLYAEAPATSVILSVKEVTDERYHLQARYTFTASNTMYSGETLLTSPPYRNGWAAKQAISEYKNHAWKVWYSPQNPQHSSLQKSFPFKECLSALILWGLLFYSIGLKKYVIRHYGSSYP